MRRRLRIVLGIIFCFSLMSCDIFKTRTPEEPSQQSSTQIQLIDPSNVLENMVSAFNDGNSVNYDHSISDASFNFTPSSNARSKYDWTAWNKDQENNYFVNVKNKLPKNSKATLTFTQTSYGIPTEICEVTTQYRLDVPYTVPGVIKIFKGLAQFELVRDSKTNEWSIQNWIDSDPGSTASDSTWSDLKGAFAH